MGTLGRRAFFAFLFFFVPPLNATSVVPTSSSVEDIWLESLAFVESQGDYTTWELLTKQILERHPSNLKLVSKGALYFLETKNREGLYHWILEVFKKNSCFETPNLNCQKLTELWKEYLLKQSFYEDSSVKLLSIKKLLEEKPEEADCQTALVRVADLKKREGPWVDLLELERELHQCLDSAEQVLLLDAEIKRFKIF